MPRINRVHKHYSSLKAVERDLISKGKGRDLESAILTDIFSRISETEISMCRKSCPVYKEGRCLIMGKEAPLGEKCEPQRISRERSF